MRRRLDRIPVQKLHGYEFRVILTRLHQGDISTNRGPP